MRVQPPPQSSRGSLQTTLTATQRSRRPPEAPGVCGLSKSGAFFLPFPWRDYQLHVAQKLRLNLLSRNRGSRGSSARRVRLSASPPRPSEFEIAKVRTEPQRTYQAIEEPQGPAEAAAFLRGPESDLGSCTLQSTKQNKTK